MSSHPCPYNSHSFNYTFHEPGSLVQGFGSMNQTLSHCQVIKLLLGEVTLSGQNEKEMNMTRTKKELSVLLERNLGWGGHNYPFVFHQNHLLKYHSITNLNMQFFVEHVNYLELQIIDSEGLSVLVLSKSYAFWLFTGNIISERLNVLQIYPVHSGNSQKN